MDKSGKSREERRSNLLAWMHWASINPMNDDQAEIALAIRELSEEARTNYDACRESRSAEVEEKVSYYKKSGMEWQAKAFDLSAKLAEEEADYKSLSDKYLGLQEEIAEQAAEIARLRGSAQLGLNQIEGMVLCLKEHGQNINVPFLIDHYEKMAELVRVALAPQAKVEKK